MITTTEIRLGNWIADEKSSPFQVDSIFEGYNNDPLINIHSEGSAYGDSSICGDSLNGCQPIPLTPAILEQCGFVYKMVGIKEHYFWDKMVMLNTYKDKLAYYYESQLCDNEVKSLHQLQNLYFALTGQELTYTPLAPDTFCEDSEEARDDHSKPQEG